MSKFKAQTLTTSYAALPAVRCGEVSILNTAGESLLIRNVNDTSNVLTIPDGKAISFNVVHQAAEFEVKAAAGGGDIQVVMS